MMVYRALRSFFYRTKNMLQYLYCLFVLRCNGIEHKKIRCKGIPFFSIDRESKLVLGDGFAMNNGYNGNLIGCRDRCLFVARGGGGIDIGQNVGISQTALIAHNADITIGDNVKIGGGTCIYTTDFHSIDSKCRASSDDTKHAICKPVTIGNNVFIGARCMVLKGVSIGDDSIVGAGSIVTKSIPPRQIWAGNPAKFIKSL